MSGGDNDYGAALASIEMDLDAGAELFEPAAGADPDPGPGNGDRGDGGEPEAPPAGSPRPPGTTPLAGTSLPKDCPVIPLGVEGDWYHYIDALGQLRSFEAKAHHRLNLSSLAAADKGLMAQCWPKYKPDPEGGPPLVTGVDFDNMAFGLMNACASRGVWVSRDRERGRGAWKSAAGELVMHHGDAVFIGARPELGMSGGRWVAPGLIDGYVYPRKEALPRPSDRPQDTGETGPAAALLELLKTWNWKRGETDAVLLLGWIACAMVAGAVEWRPVCWITGGTGTGKSTLHKLLDLVFDGGLLTSSEASAAAVWQTLGHATLPVSVDELEADEDNRKADRVVKLARDAASGAILRRGGADHKSVQFTVRTCFLFSSILIPPLQGQDRNRMAVLDLEKLDRASPRPLLPPDTIKALGAGLRRLWVDHWADFERVLETYRAALIEEGHNARGADVFGTLLAAAHLVLWGGEIDGPEAADWAHRLRAADLADEGSDETKCLQHLLTTRIEPKRGHEWVPLGLLIQRAAGRQNATVDDIDQAKRVLGTYGVKVDFVGVGQIPIIAAEGEERALEPGPYVFIANAHQGLQAIFRDTHWAGKSGTAGVWSQAFIRLAGAAKPRSPIYFVGGATARAVAVPLDSIVAEDPEPARYELFDRNELSQKGDSDDPLDGVFPD